MTIAFNFVFISLLFVVLLLQAQVICCLVWHILHFMYIVSSIFYSLLFHLILILRLVHVYVAVVCLFSQLNFIVLRRQSLFIPFLVSGPSGLFPVFCHRKQCCCEHTSTCPVFTLLVRFSLNDRLLFFVLTCLSLVTGEVGHLSCIH